MHGDACHSPSLKVVGISVLMSRLTKKSEGRVQGGQKLTCSSWQQET